MTPEPPGAIVAYRITHEKPGRTIVVTFFIRVYDRPLARFPGNTLAVLHAQNTLKTLLVEVLKDVFVVDLARPRLLSARVVADVESGDLLPGGIDVGYQVALRDLLMV
jgi:hypothetical protein